MLLSNSQPRPIVTAPGHGAMSSQRTAELSRNQSGDSGPASPVSSRSESGSMSPSRILIHLNGEGSTSDMSEDTDQPSGSRNSGGDSIDFRFLNFSHPKEAKNAQTRRDVRSHVTGVQHAKSRKAAAEQARRSQQPSSSSTLAASQNVAYLESETSSPEGASPTSPPGSPPIRLNPAEVYPEEWQPYLRPVIEHYLTYMAVDIPETDSQSRRLLRGPFFDLILSDRASLHAVMLVAGAHWNKVRPAQQHRINLLQLRGMAIREINQALADHVPGGRGTSDPLIVAVGKMATYELLFGTADTFHTHMTGLQRMVSIRGGLQMLNGIESRLLERTLLWIDANAAGITGGALYFPPQAFSSTFGHPQGNRQLFAIGVQGS